MRLTAPIRMSTMTVGFRTLAGMLVVVSFFLGMAYPLAVAWDESAPSNEIVLSDEGEEESETDSLDNQNFVALAGIPSIRLFEPKPLTHATGENLPRTTASIHPINSTGPPDFPTV